MTMDVNELHRAGQLPSDPIEGTGMVGLPAVPPRDLLSDAALELLRAVGPTLDRERCDAIAGALEAARLAAEGREREAAPGRAVAKMVAAVDVAAQDPVRRLAALVEAETHLATARVAAGVDPELVLGSRPIVGLDIFAPLPEVPWLCRDLQWAPGRPAQVQGYGGAGKTIAVSAAALSLAAGRPIWKWFLPTRRARVIHLDFDQGKNATLRRYQRLARGMSLDPREIADHLKIVPRPRVRLTSFNEDRQAAVDAFAKAVAGYDFAVLDALRGLVAGVDENDSRIRDYLDILGDVSEMTGCTFLFLHHSGKGRAGSDRPDTEAGRGSSAIQDGSGSVLLFTADPDHASVVSVKMTRDSADREGARPEPHYLEILDVEIEGEPTAGLRVEYRTCEQIEGVPAAKVDDSQLKLYRAILTAVKAGPGCAVQYVKGVIGGNGQKVSDAISALLGAALGAPLSDKPAPGTKGGTKALYLAGDVDPDTYHPPMSGGRTSDKSPCQRCEGSGEYKSNGTCFRCDGTGEEPKRGRR